MINRQAISGEYSITIAKSVLEVEELRQSWEAMQWHPNADIDFYLTVLSCRAETLRPYVISISQNGNPRAMAIGRMESTRLRFDLGYRTLCESPARVLMIIYGGLLGEESAEASKTLLSEIIKSLRRREADAVMFNSLPLNSPMYQLAKKTPGFFSRDHIEDLNLHWKMELPSGIGDFLKKMSSKHRYWLRRLEKTLEKDFPGQIVFKTFRKEEETEQLCIHSEEIACKTYQRGLGVGFVNDRLHQQRMRLAAKRCWLRAYLLYVNNQPSAFWIGTAYKGVFYLDFTGYDPMLKKYEPGTLLFMKMIEDCCRDNIQEVDFGFGDAFYKSRFGDHKWNEASVFIFAPTAKGLKLNTLRTAVTAASHLTQGLASRFNVVDKMKKRWRQKLVQEMKD